MLYKIFGKIKAFAYLVLGTMILAIGINLFIAPHNLAFGGVTGTTIIIQSLTSIPIFVSNIVLSSIVILFGWFDLGRNFMVKTIIPTILLPLFLFLTTPLSRFTISLPFSALAGAFTVGCGIGLTMHAGGSTAGPDTIGLILKKHFSIPVIRTMLLIDILVILLGYHVYGIETALWSIGVAIIMNVTVNLVKQLLSKNLIFRYWHKHKCSTELSKPKSIVLFHRKPKIKSSGIRYTAK